MDFPLIKNAGQEYGEFGIFDFVRISYFLASEDIEEK
jgi:hypothetical protein